MKKIKDLLAKLYLFFTSEKLSKYLLVITIYLSVFIICLLFASGEVVGNIVGTMIGFIFSGILIYFLKVFFGNLEDMMKVTNDIDKILSIYKDKSKYEKIVTINNTKERIAYRELFINNNYVIKVIDDSDKMFTLDDFLGENFTSLFLAHTRSTKQNSMTIRLDDFKKTSENEYTFYFSRSTYYNHLVTNRAMDFRLEDGLTIRDMYEYGPDISPINKSKMSNHVGINGLVFLKNGELLIPRRKSDSTISKRMVTSSIATKLDVRPSNKEVDEQYLLHDNIMNNLVNRTKINPEWLSSDINIVFLGFGQNLYEGGKPQFYYYVKLNDITREDYLAYHEKKKNDTNQSVIDRDKCVYVADMDSLKLEKGRKISFSYYLTSKNNKVKKTIANYEESYLCNFWHYYEKVSK